VSYAGWPDQPSLLAQGNGSCSELNVITSQIFFVASLANSPCELLSRRANPAADFPPQLIWIIHGEQLHPKMGECVFFKLICNARLMTANGTVLF
jgi:hypothetical protein